LRSESASVICSTRQKRGVLAGSHQEEKQKCNVLKLDGVESRPTLCGESALLDPSVRGVCFEVLGGSPHLIEFEERSLRSFGRGRLCWEDFGGDTGLKRKGWTRGRSSRGKGRVYLTSQGGEGSMRLLLGGGGQGQRGEDSLSRESIV